MNAPGRRYRLFCAQSTYNAPQSLSAYLKAPKSKTRKEGGKALERAIAQWIEEHDK
jgi:hypothetical protein